MRLRAIAMGAGTILLFAIGAAADGRAHAAGIVDPLRDEFVQPSPSAARLDAALQRYSAIGFSGVVFVQKDGLVVLHKGYGLSDRTTGAQNRTDTPFPIGSLTKLFTAATILRLQMEGMIDTGDPVAKYVPSFHPAAPSRKAAGKPTTVHDLLAGGDDGYRYASEIIATISGVPYETCVAERLLGPARMRRTWFLGGTPADSIPIARGHSGPDATLRRISKLPGSGSLLSAIAGSLRKRAENLAPVAPAMVEVAVPGAGGMISTAGDLFEWSLALTGDAVLSETARTQLFNPIDNSVSYGWRFERTARGTPRMSCTGDLRGYQSGIWIYPNDQLVVVLLANNDMGWREVVRGTIETREVGRSYTLLFALGGLVLLYLMMQGGMRRRVPYRWKRHGRAYP